MRSKVHAKRRSARRGGGIAAVLGLGVLLVSGCGNVKTEDVYPDPDPKAGRHDPYEKSDSIFGEDGFSFGTGRRKRQDEGATSGIGVNSYLWRASLDTIAFMPVASADPFGGVIITDWHAMPETPRERFKVNVYILSRALRADGVKVAVFRQVQEETGVWRDAGVPIQTATSIEDSILSRARQLRFDTMEQ